MRLILVRHGQTSSNVDHLLDTVEPGADLTDLGHRQAQALPEALADEPIDLVVTSTLVRTQQTAAPLAAALGIDPWVRAGIREISAGDLEMRGDEEAIRAYLGPVIGWGSGDLSLRVPGGENGMEFYTRFDAVVDEIDATGAGTAVAVSHGGAIRSWVPAKADNVDGEFAARTAVGNTGAVVLEGSQAHGWTVLTWEGRTVGGPESVRSGGPTGEPVDIGF